MSEEPVCEALFERLSDTDPEALIALMPNLEVHDLTFAAEWLGRSKHHRAAEVLIPLLKHPAAVVREGAVYGLSNLEITNTIRFALLQHADAEHEASPGVREAAQEALDDLAGK